jgi:DNA mismatch endonuclease, patch repair protein
MDVLTPQQRSHCMSRITGKNTRPEILIRSALFALGLRYRLHRRDLPGTPDLVFPKYKAVILIHGCFWHGHACGLFVVPATNTEFWIKKIGGNQQRDRDKSNQLKRLVWRVFTVWECAMRGVSQQPKESIAEKICKWLKGSSNIGEIPSQKRRHGIYSKRTK